VHARGIALEVLVPVPATPLTPSPFTAEQQKIFDAEVAKLVTHYPPEHRSAALIPVLHTAQRLQGWLSEQTMDYCGDTVGVPHTRVREVITFYTMFHTKPVGKTHVQICVNLSCWLLGSDKLVATCKKTMGTRQFEPTADGRHSWCEVECLAACGGAPAAQINDQYYENLSVDQLEKVLSSK